MRKIITLCLTVLLLSGCSPAKDIETVSDVLEEPKPDAVRQIQLSLPEEATAGIFHNGSGGTLYHCGDYIITVETFLAGDLEKTIKNTSGFGKNDLTVLSTVQKDLKRYDFAWASTGEGTQQISRAAVLDDGSWHYVLTVMAEAEEAGALEAEWNSLLASFTAVDTAA